MSNEIIFKAQPLNNEGSSIIQVDGEKIPKENKTKREEVNKKINDISRLGKTVYFQNGIEILRHNSYIIIELQTKSLDVIQRHAPIVCSTSVLNITKSPDTLADSINTFTSNINRELLPQREQIIQSLKFIDKNTSLSKKGLIDFFIDLLKKILSTLKK